MWRGLLRDTRPTWKIDHVLYHRVTAGLKVSAELDAVPGSGSFVRWTDESHVLTSGNSRCLTSCVNVRKLLFKVLTLRSGDEYLSTLISIEELSLQFGTIKRRLAYSWLRISSCLRKNHPRGKIKAKTRKCGLQLWTPKSANQKSVDRNARNHVQWWSWESCALKLLRKANLRLSRNLSALVSEQWSLLSFQCWISHLFYLLVPF